MSKREPATARDRRDPLRAGRAAVFHQGLDAANGRAAKYRFYSRQFVGTGRKDAIPILHRWPVRGEARTGAFHSKDLPDTIGDEFDSVWLPRGSTRPVRG